MKNCWMISACVLMLFALGAWLHAQEVKEQELPVFAMGASKFQKGRIPGKAQARDVWRLGSGWTWARDTGRGDKACLAAVHGEAAVSEAWARTPTFGRYDQFIYPEYEISAWIKTEDVSGKGISLGFIAEEPKKGAHFYPAKLTGTNDWTKVSFRTRLPAHIWKGKLVLKFEGAGKVWIDDLDFWFKIPGYKVGPVTGGTEILDFKDGWKFTLDLEGNGTELGWAKADFDDSAWKPIQIDKGWDVQEWGKYDGLGWYRLHFKVPEAAKGKRLFLTFGAVDEDAYVWLNGKYVGRHFGWGSPFHLEVTDAVTFGGENVMAVKVYDTLYQGGIWKPVKLVSLDKKKSKE
jgi:hypothetical protein